MAVQGITQSAVTSHDTLCQQRLDLQLRQLEFSALLHRKLDLERLFECLLIEGQSFVSFDGIQYHATADSADLVLGFTRQHRQRFEMKLGQRSLGEVSFMRATPFSARDERDVEKLVESLIYPLDNALEHYRVSMKAMTDDATGLRNQRALDELLPREIRLVRRVEESLSVILISVDNLQDISENHGQEAGDHAWRSVAETLSRRLRQSDLIFRTRQDDFCIVLNQTDIDGALILAERLRQEVDRCVSLDNLQFVLTASAGVTELSFDDDASALMERVHEALTLAQNVGRNQVRALAPTAPIDGDDPTAA